MPHELKVNSIKNSDNFHLNNYTLIETKNLTNIDYVKVTLVHSHENVISIFFNLQTVIPPNEYKFSSFHDRGSLSIIDTKLFSLGIMI
jgi:uncharacterized protein (UPF0333 family)